jgi:hypothetical protein
VTARRSPTLLSLLFRAARRAGPASDRGRTRLRHRLAHRGLPVAAAGLPVLVAGGLPVAGGLVGADGEQVAAGGGIALAAAWAKPGRAWHGSAGQVVEPIVAHCGPGSTGF